MGDQLLSVELFRIDYNRDASEGAWVRAHTESLATLGVLVPVEIDYEAAKTCEPCKGSGVMLEPHELGMNEKLSCPDCRGTGQWINDEAVRYVLRQALGIGGEDG